MQNKTLIDVEIVLPISIKKLRRMRPQTPIQSLILHGGAMFTKKMAEEITTWPEISEIHIWPKISRSALNVLISVSGLRSLIVNEIHPHGKFDVVPQNCGLASFTCDFTARQTLFWASEMPSLLHLRAHHSHLDAELISRFVQMNKLTQLDIEGSNFDDSMAEIIAQAKSIEVLYIGGTQAGRRGLEYVGQLKNLRDLDIWSLNILAEDFASLASLTNLESLSFGGRAGPDGIDFLAYETVQPFLDNFRSLKRVWMDGVYCSDAEIGLLKDRYEDVRVDPPLEY